MHNSAESSQTGVYIIVLTEEYEEGCLHYVLATRTSLNDIKKLGQQLVSKIKNGTCHSDIFDESGDISIYQLPTNQAITLPMSSSSPQSKITDISDVQGGTLIETLVTIDYGTLTF